MGRLQKAVQEIGKLEAPHNLQNGILEIIELYVQHSHDSITHSETLQLVCEILYGCYLKIVKFNY